MSKISFIILIFVSAEIMRLEEQLIINHFLITSFFEVEGEQGVESLWGDCRFIPADWRP